MLHNSHYYCHLGWQYQQGEGMSAHSAVLQQPQSVTPRWCHGVWKQDTCLIMSHNYST
jgi:hypothetical protein